MNFSRRSFTKTLAFSAAAAAMPSAFAAPKARKIHIGYTGITWDNQHIDDAITTVASLGYYGFETFGEVIEKYEANGGIKKFCDEHNKLPFISGYCTINLVDTTKKDAELEKATKWAKLIKKNDGRIFVLGPNQVNRVTYKYSEHKADIVKMMNEVAKRVTDEGITPVFHQHTGTCVESKDETYETLHAVNTHLLKFGPDVGQLTKGGVDAVQVVKDFLPIIHHMHLKDYNGTDDHLLNYCPLGEGKVNVPAILDLMEGRNLKGMVMVELDSNWRDPSPTPAPELCKRSRDYLVSQGVKFRS